MTKLNITSGIVSVEDGIKGEAGDFNPRRKARVELHFEIPEGNDHDAHVTGVADLAQAHLHSILHKTKAPAGSAVIAEAQKAPAASAKPAKVDKAAKPKAPEKTKADLEAEMLAEASGPAAEPEIAADDDNLDDILGEAAPDPITDKQLSDACVAKAASNSKVAGWEPKKIRALIEEFTGAPGKHNREIPADKRPDFLKRLEALK